MELPVLGESSTDNLTHNNHPSSSSSTPSTPSNPENPRYSWGHQRSWSTSILGPDKSKNYLFNSTDLNPDSVA